jgi:UDP-GlcNAc:undecaprenyl-phosphate/decaprenyl-phosphate GlcNAc-1-phosphate transferase
MVYVYKSLSSKIHFIVLNLYGEHALPVETTPLIFSDFVLPFTWSLIISVFAIPSIIFVAHVKNLLDEPNVRTVHHSLTPRLGGVAIFAGFTSSITIFGSLHGGVQFLLAGCIILFFIGVKDDLVSVSTFKKFFIQVLATGIVMFLGDIRITSFQGVLGIHELDIGTSYAFTFLVIMGISNSINLIDGLDGLAGTILLIVASTFGLFIHYYGGAFYSPYAIVAVCLVGAIIGFLRYNFYNAVVFMGDTGSLVSGLVVSVLAIEFIEMAQVPAGPSMAVCVLIVPIFDTLRVFFIRIFKGVSPFSPDKNHIHHQLLRIGLSQLQTVFALAGFNLLMIFMCYWFSGWGNSILVAFIFTMFILVNLSLELFGRGKAQGERG